MKWDAQLYQNQHSFVAEHGKGLLSYLDSLPTQAILDVGCGTGTLTHELCKRAGKVVGIDASREMIARARERYPDIEFHVMDALALPYREEFDVAFSNAVFHWIPAQGQLLGKIFTALKPGGWLICEFGAQGNTRAIQQAFGAALENRGDTYRDPFFFPTAQEYGALLGDAGFTVQALFEYDRPTPLDGGQGGLRSWVAQFSAWELEPFCTDVQTEIFGEMEEALRPILWDTTQ